MRCRECAAEVAVTARVCSGCGAPIVEQPQVVADTVVADTVVGAVSDAAGNAVAAEVAEPEPPEPYVPGSGARLPTKLRLVLAGYAGIACLCAGGMALAAAAAVFLLFFVDDVDPDDDMYGLLFGLACGAFIGGLFGAFEALEARIRFSRLLRRRQRSTHGHGDGLETWRTHTDTRHHPPGRHRPRVPVAVRGSPRVVAEGRHAGAR